MDLFSTPEEIEREMWRKRLKAAGYWPQLGRSGAIIGWRSPDGRSLEEDNAIAELRIKEEGS